MSRYISLSALLIFTLFSCGNETTPPVTGDTTADPKVQNVPTLEEKQQKTSFIIETTIDSMDIPHSNVTVDFYDTRAALDAITCSAQLYTKEEFKDMDIPDNAITACGGWFAGGGDYYYIAPTPTGIAVYKGWQDEGQEDVGYHWEKFKEIN